MYIKLALRNAKRSFSNYFLSIITMTILIAIMYVSNCIAIFGRIQAGFQTASLPLLIVIIMIALVNYINTFMMKQRAKEFGIYLLLGMERKILSKMFRYEFFLIGIMCFILGVTIGMVFFVALFQKGFEGVEIQQMQEVQSILQTFLFFCILEGLSAIQLSKKINNLQIIQLMNENRLNQTTKESSKNVWGACFIICFTILILLLYGIVFWSDNIVNIIISFISIPLIGCIVTFYQWLYAYVWSMRLTQSDRLYQGNRLYCLSEISSGTKTNARMSCIYCICLLFAIQSFVFGALLFQKEVKLFEHANQQWMGILQLSISIIFLVIYFSTVSFAQMIELKRQAKNIGILFYMGKSKAQIKALLRKQILLKLFVPISMCFALLLISTPFINYKINRILPSTIHHTFIFIVLGFVACFVVLYLCYYYVVYVTSIRYLNQVLKLNY